MRKHRGDDTRGRQVAVSGSLWQSARMRVFVTGVAGFVGQRLEARLQAAGAQVIGTDLELDVGDADRVAEAVTEARPDAIVHLAAISFVPEAESNPQAVYRANFLGAHSILEAAQKISPDVRVLLVGSGYVYGAADPGAPPFDESSPLRPDSHYAWSKAAADLLGGFYEGRGVDVVRVRPFNHTGPGRPDRFVESSFARQIAEIAFEGNQGPAGVAHSPGGYRTVFLGFPFEALPGEADRQAVMAAFLGNCSVRFSDGFDSGDTSAWSRTVSEGHPKTPGT